MSAQAVHLDPAATPAEAVRWIDVCDAAVLVPGRGVRALVHGAAVAVFSLPVVDEDGRSGAAEVTAISDLDPFTGASVLSRGLVGTTVVDGQPVVYVASPLRKQRVDLHTGRSLDDPAVSVDVWPVRVVGGRLLVGAEPVVVDPR